jgi:hypothetical protein
MPPGTRKRSILAFGLALCLMVMATGRQAIAAGRDHAASWQGGEAFVRAEGRRVVQAGEVTPEKIERWRTMTPEERERIRERYRRWKELPPERKARILERRRRWRELPERQRRFLSQRREIYRSAGPQERRTIEKFARRWRDLPREQRRALRNRLAEWRDLPEDKRDERMMEWPFYRRFSPDERKAVNRFLFSRPSPGPKGGPPGSSRD